jgi:hypothetical protein
MQVQAVMLHFLFTNEQQCMAKAVMIHHFLQLLYYVLLSNDVGELHEAKIGFAENKKAEVIYFCFLN